MGCVGTGTPALLLAALLPWNVWHHLRRTFHNTGTLYTWIYSISFVCHRAQPLSNRSHPTRCFSRRLDLEAATKRHLLHRSYTNADRVSPAPLAQAVCIDSRTAGLPTSLSGWCFDVFKLQPGGGLVCASDHLANTHGCVHRCSMTVDSSDGASGYVHSHHWERDIVSGLQRKGEITSDV